VVRSHARHHSLVRIVALIDNGSLEPAAHRNLRAVAAALSERTGTIVHAVSWKHSDRISPAALDEIRAWTLASFVRTQLSRGERDFVFIPFFISAQGAIGSALRSDLDKLREQLGDFSVTFTDDLDARGALSRIVVARIRAVIVTHELRNPAVIVVDHGGPSAASAMLRDRLGLEVHRELDGEIGPLAAASMEGAHPPLFADQLRAPALAHTDVIVAPLFLSPGRHAGPEGDLAQIAGASTVRCHFADLVGTHPLVVETLAASLSATLSRLPAETLA
jgi:sirohydrochlorin ferrochelatase